MSVRLFDAPAEGVFRLVWVPGGGVGVEVVCYDAVWRQRLERLGLGALPGGSSRGWRVDVGDGDRWFGWMDPRRRHVAVRFRFAWGVRGRVTGKGQVFTYEGQYSAPAPLPSSGPVPRCSGWCRGR